jgi:DNA-binding protein HU-beta
MTAGSSCGEEREGGGVVTKADLIDEVTKYSTMKKKDVTDLVEAVFNVMTDALKRHEKVQIVGFGTFEPRRRKARVGRDPRTQDEIRIPSSWSLNFRPGKQLKEKLSGRKASR